MQTTEQAPLVDMTPIPPQFRIHKDRIKVGQRMREDLGTLKEQQDLADSILEFGLIHPCTVDEQANLIAGGRRFHVMTTILKWDTIPVSLGNTEGSMAKLRMMELEENIRRKQMNWKEHIRSIAEVHRLYRKESFLKGEKWTKAATGELLGISIGNVQYCVEVEKLLLDSKHPIQNAEGLNDAFRILLKLKEDEIAKHESTLVKDLQTSGGFKQKGATLSIDSLIQGLTKTEDGSVDEKAIEPSVDVAELIEGLEPDAKAVVLKKDTLIVDVTKYFVNDDCIVQMTTKMAEQSIDCIVTDIPYGIDMDMLQQEGQALIDVERVADEHDVDKNVELFHKFFPAAYRVLKENAFCVVWYDLAHHELFQQLGKQAGFKPCRWPLHWVKTHRCKNQSAQYNFTKSVEHAMVFRKGNATLVSPQGTNYWVGGNEDAVAEFGHPFAKPEGLWKWVASAVAPKGSTILDPFMGAGSGPIAFAKAGYYPRGIELKDLHYNKTIVKFKELMTRWFADKEVVFS